LFNPFPPAPMKCTTPASGEQYPKVSNILTASHSQSPWWNPASLGALGVYRSARHFRFWVCWMIRRLGGGHCLHRLSPTCLRLGSQLWTDGGRGRGIKEGIYLFEYFGRLVGVMWKLLWRRERGGRRGRWDAWLLLGEVVVLGWGRMRWSGSMCGRWREVGLELEWWWNSGWRE